MIDLVKAESRPESRTLVALTPAEMPLAQAKLRDWCVTKVKSVNAELSDLKDSLLVAKSNQWQTQSLGRAVKKAEKRVTYYQKIQAAVEAGYLIVPNFDVEVMAVRVGREKPKRLTDSYESAKITTATPDVLPAGEGRYVDDDQVFRDLSYEGPDPDRPGKMKKIGHFVVEEYDEEPDFPVTAVHPSVMDATARAMALKVFDRIGVVTGRNADPVVLGQIISPRTIYVRWPVLVSFFVAWWLDPETL